MCNDYRQNIPLEQLELEFSQVRIPLRFPEGRPNLEPRDDIRITDRGAIVRAADDRTADLIVRRWSWPGPGGNPVYNFRSDGRQFTSGRCLIVADGFYEFTDAPPVEGGPKKPPKSKWLFTMRGTPVFAVAGIWRTDPAVGEAFTMLTTTPGPDVAPYHNRQIVVLAPDDWAAWLNPAIAAPDILKPAPGGTLDVTQVR